MARCENRALYVRTMGIRTMASIRPAAGSLRIAQPGQRRCSLVRVARIGQAVARLDDSRGRFLEPRLDSPSRGWGEARQIQSVLYCSGLSCVGEKPPFPHPRDSLITLRARLRPGRDLRL